MKNYDLEVELDLRERLKKVELVMVQRGIELDAAKRRLDEIAYECEAMARDDKIGGVEKLCWERAAKIARAPLDN